MITPEKQFFIFGLGHREKHLYKDGALTCIRTDETVYKWNVVREKFLYDRYMVVVWTKENNIFLVEENEHGLYVSDITNGEERKNSVCLAESEINLPDFPPANSPCGADPAPICRSSESAVFIPGVTSRPRPFPGCGSCRPFSEQASERRPRPEKQSRSFRNG